MRILVATASRHGATREIGRQIGATITETLRAEGIDHRVDVVDAADIDSIDGYDAAIIGSAVYFGRWLASARRLIGATEHQLHAIPVWLFSSGPVDTDESVDESAPSPVTARWAREHRTFPGRLDRSSLGVFEKLFATALRVPDRDGRDPEAIDAWAREIAATLATSASTA